MRLRYVDVIELDLMTHTERVVLRNLHEAFAEAYLYRHDRHPRYCLMLRPAPREPADAR